MNDTRRGRGSDPQLTVIFWRDIPAQVKARAGRNRASAKLPDRFMLAIDAAATKSGKTSDDDYIAQWREESRICSESLQVDVDAEASNITESYTSDLIKTYVRNGGWGPNLAPNESP
jgi:hypothetical protein